VLNQNQHQFSLQSDLRLCHLNAFYFKVVVSNAHIPLGKEREIWRSYAAKQFSFSQAFASPIPH